MGLFSEDNPFRVQAAAGQKPNQGKRGDDAKTARRLGEEETFTAQRSIKNEKVTKKRKASSPPFQPPDVKETSGETKKSKTIASAEPRKYRLLNSPKAAEEAALEAKKSSPGEGEKKNGDDAEKTARSIFVGNLPGNANRKNLRQYFIDCGSIESLRLRSQMLEENCAVNRKVAVMTKKVKETPDATQHAYIVFKDASSVSLALKKNMQLFMSRHLRVDVAVAPQNQGGRVQYDYDRTLFVGNLPADITEEELISLFNQKLDKSAPSMAASSASDAKTGAVVEAVRVVRDKKTGSGKGIAYVMCNSKQRMWKALNMDSNAFQVRGRTLRVSKAIQNPENKSKIKIQKGNSSWQKSKGKVMLKPSQPGSKALTSTEKSFQGLKVKAKNMKKISSKKSKGPKRNYKKKKV